MQKILLVDDRDDNLLSIESILEPDGYLFIKASSGRQALKVLLKETDFAMILMDVNMPNLNGFETATLIYEREKLRHIPIIFITAHTYSDANVFKGYKAGAVDYIYKPINPDLLRAKVSVFIDLYKKNYRLLAQEQKLRTVNESLAKEIEVRKKSEEQVHQLNQQLVNNIVQLKTINEDLDNFVYIASHDLQEPLRKIRMFTDTLLTRHAGDMPEVCKDYLHKIERSTERMQILIEDILDFSRFSSNMDAFKETDLNEIISSVITDLEMEISERNAVIELKELPVYPVVPRMFSQLFQNLIYNALKFQTPGNIPKITVGSEKVKGILIPGIEQKYHYDDFYTISISDNGIGFEEQYAEQIFVIFKRLHSHSSFKGTGIGLAICKKIAEKHHGHIYAKSKPGAGSQFSIALPLKKKEKAVL